MLDLLHPFTQAVKLHGGRTVKPTQLTSAQLRDVAASVKRQSFFSAQTMLTDLLDQYKEDIGSIANPQTEQREDRITASNPQGNVTTGQNPAYARLNAKTLLASLDYTPEPGTEGTLQDLSSNARIDLVIRTNVELAMGGGRFIQRNNPDVIDEFPAQELFRLEARKKPREWDEIWKDAAETSGDEDAARVFEDTGR